VNAAAIVVVSWSSDSVTAVSVSVEASISNEATVVVSSFGASVVMSAWAFKVEVEDSDRSSSTATVVVSWVISVVAVSTDGTSVLIVPMKGATVRSSSVEGLSVLGNSVPSAASEP